MDVTPSRKLLLGITGGIAAYKSAELARLFVKAGWQVQVVMTAHATEFIAPLTFQALTGHETHGGLHDGEADAAGLAQWPDAILIAPATANTLARLAHGLGEGLLSALCLASDKPLFVAPAMNRLMWSHAATQANVALLRQRGVITLGPGSGAQACGEVGEGRMMEPQMIFDALSTALDTPKDLRGLHAVITAGPTREPLDPVRYLSSSDTGEHGYALAAALLARGAKVTLISGPTRLATPQGLTRIDVESAGQMLGMSLAVAAEADLFIAAAAAAGYRAGEVAPQKIKKTGETLQLVLRKNPDVLASVRAALPTRFAYDARAEAEHPPSTEATRAMAADIAARYHHQRPT